MGKQNRRSASVATALLVTAGLFGASMAKAQSPANADAAYNGYSNTYLYNSGGTAYPTTSITNRANMGGWGEAYVIAGFEDAYERNKSSARQAVVSQLLNTYITVNFTNQNSTNESWDGYNDDLAWGTIALARGYQITGNTTYLTDAENVWNYSYSRGWDSTLGGGIWETSPVSANSNDSKCTLSNLSFIPSGIILYEATGNSTYLTESEAIYAWVRANLFNTSTGQVNECVHPTYTDTDTNVYNSGLLVNAAAYLYRLTGNTQYYNDGLLAANFQINLHPIMDVDYPNNGPFGGDQYFRGLSNFARWNNLWSTYSTWFGNNAVKAWSTRNTQYNINWDDISTTTGTGDILSMESLSPMVLHQVSQIQDIVEPFKFSGNYELLNATSNLALTVSGGSTANGAAIVQESYTGANDQLWTLTPTSGGYYHITNVNSGLALNVSGSFSAAFQNGAAVIQWPGQAIGGEDNDEWMPVQNSNGTFTFYNLNSELALDNHGASTAAGNAYDQWIPNGTSAQNFTLVSQTSNPATLIPNGNYIVTGVYSGLALENPNSALTESTVMDQWTVNSGANQQWTVTNLGNNVITLSNDASGELLEVSGASTASGALVDQFAANEGTNQQWNVISLGSGHYELTNVHSGLAIDVHGGGKATGTQIDQYAYQGNQWQQWIFTSH